MEGTDLLEPYRAFKFRGLVLVNLKLRGRGLLPDTMMWFPQGDYAFFRLCEAPLSMPWLAPDGATMITADIGATIGDEHWTMADDDLIALTVDHFARVGPDAHARCIGGAAFPPPPRHPGVPPPLPAGAERRRVPPQRRPAPSDPRHRAARRSPR